MKRDRLTPIYVLSGVVRRVLAILCLLLLMMNLEQNQGTFAQARDSANDPVAVTINREGGAWVYIAVVDTAGLNAARANHAAAIAATQAQVLSLLKPGEFTLVRQFKHVPAVFGYLTSLSALTTLKGSPLVRAVEIPPGGTGDLINSGPLIGAYTVQTDLGLTGSGITAAVIDSGIDTDHPDLADDLVAQQCFLTTNDCPGGGTTGASAEDNNGHGSHVSGIITSNGTVVGGAKGIAPDTKIVAIKVLQANNSFSTTADIVAGLDWLIDQQLDVDVINLSLGTTYRTGSVCDNNFAWLTDMKNALDAVGAINFASSGNDGDKLALSAPACLSNVIAVGSSYVKSYTTINWSACTDTNPPVNSLSCFTNRGLLLDILAPGAWIWSTVPGGGYQNYAGTSMASPTITGVAALMLQANGNLTASQMLTTMQTTGLTITDPSPGVGMPTSYQRVNALAAVNAVLDSATSTPTPTNPPATATATPDSNTATPTATLPIETPTATPTSDTGIEVVTNDGMEDDIDANKLPDGWVPKLVLNDKIKCDSETKIYAHTGECAFMFKGGVGENSQLQQLPDLTALNFSAGDTLIFSAYVSASNPAVKGKLKVRIIYADGTPQGAITLNITQTTGYQEFTSSVTIDSANVSKIKVQLLNTSPVGKVLVDDVHLILETPQTGQAVLPLP